MTCTKCQVNMTYEPALGYHVCTITGCGYKVHDFNCEVCAGEGWVCEDHPDKAWKVGDGCCGAAGDPCKCNSKHPEYAGR
jgi:hypothetical protein